MQTDKITDALVGAGYTAGAVGAGLGTWLSTYWLQVLSAVGILLTIFFQWRQDKRQRARLEMEQFKVRQREIVANAIKSNGSTIAKNIQEHNALVLNEKDNCQEE